MTSYRSARRRRSGGNVQRSLFRRDCFWAAACAALTLALACVTAPGVATAAGGESSRAETYTFAFHDADIGQIAQEILGNTLGVIYTVDPGVSGKMSFRLDQRLTRAQLLEAFEAALSANDVVLVRQGDTLALVPRAKAKTSAGLHTIGEGGVHRTGYEVVAVPLTYASPTEVAKALDAIAPANTVIYSNDKLGLLILGGSGQELDSTLQTRKVFDQNGLEASKIRFFELFKAPAQTVAADLQRVLEGAGVSGVTIVPLKRLNGLFVFARTAKALDEVAPWVAKLDAVSEEQSSLWVYHPHNASAEALSRTLNNLLFGTSNDAGSTTTTAPDHPSGFSLNTSAGSGSGSGFSIGAPSGLSPGTQLQPQPGQQRAAAAISSSSGGAAGGHADGDELHIGVDRDTNTLLISGPPTQWVQIQKILQEIDLPPKQILIEASILEVTLTNDLQFGVDWSVLGSHGKLDVQSINSPSGLVGAALPGLAVTFLDKNIQAAVNTLQSQTAVEVVSAPKIMTLDNQTAKLQVGDQVPIVTQSAQSTAAAGAPLVSSVDYRNTGIILNVTPRVSGDDKIVLTIDQEVSSVSQTTTSSINSPTIQQRSFDSTVILKNGGVVALGGLISHNKTTGRSGIPGLSNVPWVGHLFSTTTKNENRTELIVLISAKIISDTESSNRVMADLMADMREIQSRGLLKTR